MSTYHLYEAYDIDEREKALTWSSSLEDRGCSSNSFPTSRSPLLHSSSKQKHELGNHFIFSQHTKNKKSTTILKPGLKSQKPKRNHQRVKGKIEVQIDQTGVIRY